MSTTTSSTPTSTSKVPDPTSSSDSDLNLYFYNPSTVAAILFTVLYFFLLGWHLFINIIVARRAANKHKYTIPLSVACLISTAGWGVRTASIKNVSSIPLYAISASYIVISPIFVCATLYWLLTRLIMASTSAAVVGAGDEKREERQQRWTFWGVRVQPRWLGRIFITSDVLSFLTQCSGSGIASSGNWKGDLKTIGTNVLLCGLSLQLATFSVFLAALWSLCRTSSQSHARPMQANVKRVVLGVWIAGAFVQIRSVYRVVEFALGVDGYLFQHEWCLYVFEAVPIFVALSVLAWFHPVKLLQQNDSETAFALRDSGASLKGPDAVQVRSGKGC